jgi:hypothetical protein
MRREPQRAGIHMSVAMLLHQRERGRPRARRMLTEIDPTQQRLPDLFGARNLRPKR